MMKRFFMSLFVLILCIISSIGQIAFASDIIDVSVEIPDNIVGNNFFKDNLPTFKVNIKNLSSEAIECSYTAKAVNSEEKEVFGVSGIINAEAEETAEKTIEIPAVYYGVQTFKLEVLTEGDIFTAEIPFTLSNRTSDMPLNKSFGTTTHWSRGRGGVDESIELMTDAGIGSMRSEDLMWPAFEVNKGEYQLTEYQENVLSSLDENGIDYMFICNFGNENYHSPSTEPVNDEEGYDALSKYIEELLKQADGRVKYIEVWNEYHSSNMSGSFSGNAEVFAELHKAIYKGVQAGDKNVKVCAFVEDDWGFYETGMITKCLQNLGGEKAFDYVSLHPYTDDKIRYFEGDVNSDAFVEDVRAELEKYGYSKDTPIIFSELGWMNSENGDNAQAAYIVRAAAYSEAKGLAEKFFSYNLLDYYDLGGYGLVQSFKLPHTSDGIPYLGKPAYVAVSYYNGLMAEGEFISEIETKSDKSYCYNFKDRNGRSILMLGAFEDGMTEKAYIDTGASEVIVSDMFGNEKKVLTNNGIVLMNLTDEPQYIIGSGEVVSINEEIAEDDFYTASQIGENSAWIYGRLGDGKTDYTICVYSPGKSYTDLNGENNAKNTDVLVFYDQGQTDENGILDIEFNLDGVSGNYDVFIYSENKQSIIEPIKALSFDDGEIIKESIVRLGLYRDGNLLENGTSILPKEEITVKATLYKPGENAENAILVYALYDDGVLKAMDFVQGNSEDLSESVTLEKSFTVPDGVETVRGFLWDSFITQKPETLPVEVTVTQ